MRKKLLVLSVIASFTFVLMACTKKADGITGPAGPNGTEGLSATAQRSAITGYVKLVDQFYVPVSSVDSVLVSTRDGDSTIKTLTDKTGFFKLTGLGSGNYRILLSKTLYDSIAYNIIHSAGNEDQFVNYLQMNGSLTNHLTSQTFDLQPDVIYPSFNTGTITTYFDGPTTSDATKHYLYYYFSGKPNVSKTNFVYQAEGISSGFGYQYMVSYMGFQGSDINDIHFKTGDTVYMKTYFVPLPPTKTSWFDTNSYQTIDYPYVGDSISNWFLWKN